MGQVKFASKLSISIVILTTIALALATFGLSFGLFIHTEQHVKEELINNVNDVISEHLTVVNKQILQKELPNNQTLGATLRSRDLSAIIVDYDGKILARYGIYKDLDGEYLIIEKVTKAKYVDLILPNYGLFDTYTVPIYAGKDVFGYMRIIRKNTEIEILRQTIGAVILIIFPLAWCISLIFAYFMIRRVTNPLTKLAGHLEKINPDNMQFITNSNLMDYEMSVVIKAINNLIIKLREHNTRGRQITENISHEFKTPLTRIASNLQMGKIKEAESEVLELGGNVDAMLSLAIWEKTEETCELVGIIKHLSKLIPPGIKVDIQLPRKIVAPLPYSHAIVIWRNILDNAIKHNRKNGYILIRGQMKNRNWEISISNSIISSIKVAKKVTERKYRSGESAGYGIGMSIVADMCKLHDLRLEVTDNKDQMMILIKNL